MDFKKYVVNFLANNFGKAWLLLIFWTLYNGQIWKKLTFFEYADKYLFDAEIRFQIDLI